ncbi:MAG: 4-oxalocrotonate [Geobacteraceae bacterium]|nr:MAG: 4-oxalocrotonate [Geobacteraceae bacterium]
MPVIHFYGPRMPKEKKEALVKEFAQAASRATGIPVEKMITLLHETEPENIGLGDDLLANRR